MNANAEHQKRIDAMLTQLRKMHKRSLTALKKTEAQLQKEEKQYQKELVDFQRKYGA